MLKNDIETTKKLFGDIDLNAVETVTVRHGIDIHVKKNVTMEEFGKMVSIACGICMPAYEYEPHLFPFAMRISIYEVCTDITVPTEQEWLDRLICDDTLFVLVCASIGKKTLECFDEAVRQTIQRESAKQNAALAASVHPLNSLVDVVTSVLNDVKSNFKEGAVEQLSDLAGKLESLDAASAPIMSYLEKQAKEPTETKKTRKPRATRKKAVDFPVKNTEEK